LHFLDAVISALQTKKMIIFVKIVWQSCFNKWNDGCRLLRYLQFTLETITHTVWSKVEERQCNGQRYTVVSVVGLRNHSKDFVSFVETSFI